MHTYDCIFWAGPLDISDILSVQYKIKKNLFKDFRLKLPAFARTRPLLFSRTGFSNLLNKIQFTFEVVPCLILVFSDDFFEGVHQFQPRVSRGWVGGRWGGGKGWGGRRLKLPK